MEQTRERPAQGVGVASAVSEPVELSAGLRLLAVSILGLGLLGALAAAAWFLAPIFASPTFVPAGGASWRPEPTTDMLVTVDQHIVLEDDEVTLEAVRSPGATAVGAWFVPGGGDPAPEYALPQKVSKGEPGTLIIHWRIDNCGALAAPRPQITDVPSIDVDATTVFGLPKDVHGSGFGDSLLPGLDVEALNELGYCG